MLMKHPPIFIFSVFALLFDCGSSAHLPAPAAAPELPLTIYAPGDGGEAWHFQGNFWRRALSDVQLDEAPLRYARSAGAACVDLDGSGPFGAPDTLRVGTRFQCGTARFEVVACEITTDTCRIRAIWRMGVPPNGGELPVNYFYNRCRGILSITFDLDANRRVTFGGVLELRHGPGLLARPDAPGCDVETELYGGPPAPSANKLP
jgi:hypothetical protein